MSHDANHVYFDSALRHQIGVRRLASGEAKRVLALLEKADRDLVEKLRKRLIRLGDVKDFTSKRYLRLLEDVKTLRREALRELRATTTGTLTELAKMEADFEKRLLDAAIPVEVEFAAVEASALREAVFRRPFHGRLLKDWFKSLVQADQRNLQDALQLGLAQGESIQQVVRRVAGTRAAGFTDGALSITRRQAEAVVRTAVNHVSNAAREEVWKANEDIVQMLRWTATLDGRTSGICRARDGKFATIGGKPLPPGTPRLTPPGARPPAHVNCRSIMVAVIDGVGVAGDRPFVVDIRTRARREIDFRKIARQQDKPIQQVRKEWADKNIGQVPAETTYNQFLKRQSAGFQDDVLGKTKGRLFRQGKLEVDQFVDRTGNEFTLAQLAKTRPEAFRAANLDPGDF